MGVSIRADDRDIRQARGRWYTHLYVQVLIAITVGVLLGHIAPQAGAAMKPLGDAFIRLIKMVIAPVIFLTVVTGIGGMRELSGVGRVAARSLAYFLAVSTLALIVGLIVANLLEPGAGMNIDPAALDTGSIADYTRKAHENGIVAFLMDIIPTTLIAAVAEGNILQALFVAILFGIALTLIGERGRPLMELFDAATHTVFRLVSILMRAAPIGAFGAMAFTVGAYGLASLASLAELVVTFYATALLFVLLVLGLIARAAGFRIVRLIVYLRSELLLVLGTSSSEAALPSLVEKMERAGCDKSVVGLVVPTGYSFNLDGTNIYMTLAALFIAQATNTHLSIDEQISLLLVAMISSKGAAGVTGAGFVTLAATLSIVPSVPVAGMTLILGIDRFMSECRSLTNFMGNAVATIVIAAWEGKLDRTRLDAAMAGEPLPPLGDLEAVIAD
ncbi:MAG TPA: dicarboxylate/amino acid:cation symporter [Sphingobium sp.]|nr:dicarboxylate/amino acid:cation symporter [Sphingobium sp.]